MTAETSCEKLYVTMVFQNNETAVMLVCLNNPLRVVNVKINVNLIYSGHTRSYTSTKLS